MTTVAEADMALWQWVPPSLTLSCYNALTFASLCKNGELSRPESPQAPSR